MDPETERTARRSSRFHAGLQVLIRHAGVDLQCSAENLSRSGALLVAESPWPEVDQVDLLLRTTGGDLQVHVMARVVRRENRSQGADSLLGVEFLDLTPRQREAVENLIARVVEGRAPAPLESLRPGAPAQEIRSVLEKVPLAHRIAQAARAPTPMERDVLRHDTHHQVLASLARNPNLMPGEVRNLAASLHISSTTLEAIASDPRWARDEELRILIASHPRVPIPLALRLADRLSRAGKKRLVQRPSLAEPIRAELLKKIRRP
jgi:hypothetical protein